MLSVVCAMRNVEHCVGELLASYRRESREDIQLVVIDGASTDATWEILLRNRDIIDVAISEPDSGIYDAWNKALPHCAGDYVSFIGADDRIAGCGLAQIIAALSGLHFEAHVVAGFNVLTRQGVPVALLGAPYNADQLCRRIMIAQVLSAHRLSWLRSVGGFDASYRSSGDYELLLRERESLRVEVINSVLAYMEDGGTSRASLLPFFEDYRARLNNGVPRWQCVALLVRAFLWVVARKLGLR